MVFGGEVLADLLQVGAVQVDHPAAALAPQQKAVVGVARLRAELIQRPLLGGDLVYKPLLRQPVKLTVHRGKSHGQPLMPQIL